MKPVSGQKLVKILCKEFGFEVSRQKGSHIVLRNQVKGRKIVTVVPDHKELKRGTLRNILRLAEVDIEEFYQV